MNGFFSANDLEASDATISSEAVLAVLSDLATDSFAALVLVLRRIPSVGERAQQRGDGDLLEATMTRRESMDEANMMNWVGKALS